MMIIGVMLPLFSVVSNGTFPCWLLLALCVGPQVVCSHDMSVAQIVALPSPAPIRCGSQGALGKCLWFSLGKAICVMFSASSVVPPRIP